MGTTNPNHMCWFELEETADGSFTGDIICIECGKVVAPSLRVDSVCAIKGHPQATDRKLIS